MSNAVTPGPDAPAGHWCDTGIFSRYRNLKGAWSTANEKYPRGQFGGWWIRDLTAAHRGSDRAGCARPQQTWRRNVCAMTLTANAPGTGYPGASEPVPSPQQMLVRAQE